jgi:hypothetical protein
MCDTKCCRDTIKLYQDSVKKIVEHDEKVKQAFDQVKDLSAGLVMQLQKELKETNARVKALEERPTIIDNSINF